MQNTRRALAYLDLLFQHRNKRYGAYELRAHYSTRLRRAAGAVLFSAALLALTPVLMAAISGEVVPTVARPKVDTIVLNTLPPEQEKPQPEPLPDASAPKPVATQKFALPKIVENDVAHEEDILQPVDSVRAISNENREGDSALATDIPSVSEGNGRGTLVEQPKQPATGPVTIVDVLAEFPGDVREYLASRLEYPEQARIAGIDGRVVVRFVVDEEGRISGATVARGIGGGCDEEALRVVRSMPRWKPAQLNGRVVKSYFNLPIKFTLGD